MKNDELPDGWQLVPLGTISEINPRRPSNLQREDEEPTTFVPMAAVDDLLGAITSAELRPFIEVKKGYTYFEQNDVLFAKITPCMQNGKHAIARNLIGGFGFGTTEFHVIRPNDVVTSEWLHLYLRQPSILEYATTFFTGAVGQQRVPKEFLENLLIPLPPLAEQQRITAIIEMQMAEVETARAAVQAQLTKIEQLPATILYHAFNGEL